MCVDVVVDVKVRGLLRTNAEMLRMAESAHRNAVPTVREVREVPVDELDARSDLKNGGTACSGRAT
jgi:hypothetical protein